MSTNSRDKEETLKNMIINEKKTQNSINEVFHLQIKGNYLTIINNPQMNHILQEFIPQTDKAIVEEIFYEIRPKLFNFLIHPYSNYLCQKIYVQLGSIATSVAKQNFLNYIFERFHGISCNKAGTFLIQRILTSMQSEYEINKVYDFLKNITKKLYDSIAYVSEY